MRLLRRRAAVGRAGVHATGAPGLDGAAGAVRDRALRRREPRAGRRHRHQRPAPARRAPERRQPDLACLRGRSADRLRREPRAPRRCRWWRPRLDRRLPGGVPGRRDHPARQGRRRRQDRGRRLPPHPRPDPVEARDGRRLPGADRGQRDGGQKDHGAVQPPRPRDPRRDDGGAARLHRAAGAGGDRAARAGNVRGRRCGGQRRLHRPAGPAPGSNRDRARRPPLRHVGVGPTAAGSGQLDLRNDLLGVCLCVEVPDRSRPARERRLLPALQPERSRGNGDELHLARAGRRRLGDPDPPRRGDVPAPSCLRSRSGCRQAPRG